MLGDILTLDEINYFKEHKDQITPELLDILRSKGNLGKKIALSILDTPSDELGFYLDAFGQRIFFDADKALKPRETKMNLSEIHIREMEKCRDDIFYFMDNYIQILTKSGISFPDLRDYQREILDLLKEDHNEKVIIKLGRQGGKSITTGIFLLHVFMFNKDLTIGILANKGAMSIEYLDKVKKMFVLLPMWMKCSLETWNKKSIANDCNVRIITDVPSDGSFRGFTCNYIIFDEAAWTTPNKFNDAIDALLPSMSSLSKKKLILVSTPNGMNHFFEIWRESGEDRESSNNGYIRFETDWRNIPRYKPNGELYDPEDFKRSIIKSSGEIFFAQNYSCEFAGSSNTLIPGEYIQKMFSKTPVRRETPGLMIYEEVQKDHKYIIGVDPAKDGKDYFSVQILDITSLHFKQVATAHLQVDYLEMPDILKEWGELYNTALIVIENNEGAGQSIADTLYRSLEYENLFFDFSKEKNENLSQDRKKYPGFRTTKGNRELLCQTLKSLILNEKLEIVDNDTINEFLFFKYKNDKYQAEEGKHDDLIMSLCMCLVMFINIKNFEDFKTVIDGILSKESKILEEGDFLNIGTFDDGTNFKENQEYGEFDEFGFPLQRNKEDYITFGYDETFLKDYISTY